MKLLFLALLIVPVVLSVVWRLIVSHPWATSYYAVSDLADWIGNRKFNDCPYGTIKCYIAHAGTAFGTGKTLSAVREITSAYKRYNGRKVWDSDLGEFVPQRILVLSNVDFLTIPFDRLVSLSQFVKLTDEVLDFDKKNHCRTITYLLIDEASSQLNSRSFKSNFDAPFISRLLTSRHVRANLILTSQRSGMVDKLMRDCCNLYISCQKIWRFEILRYYDAYRVETAQDPASVAPLRRTGYFIKDSMFDSYDTFAMVKSLEKSCKEGDMLTDEEILNLRVGDSLADARANFKRQAKKSKKAKKSR